MGQWLKISTFGLTLIKTYEGFRPKSRQLVSGQRVVGYGHRVNGHEDISLTKTAAETRLKDDLKPIEDMINENVHAPLTQGQFDALCSLAFNIGPKAFLSSNVLHALNNGRPLDAANGFDLWRKSHIDGRIYVVDALVRRRAAEKALFLKPENRKLEASRIALPALVDAAPNHETEPSRRQDDMPLFTHEDAQSFFAEAPYDAPIIPRRRREDHISSPIGLSEIQTDMEPTEANVLNDSHNAITEGTILELDAEEILTDSKVSENSTITPVVEVEAEAEAEAEIQLEEDGKEDDSQNEVLKSPIAEAAADVIDQLDALFEGPISKTDLSQNSEHSNNKDNHKSVSKIEENTLRPEVPEKNDGKKLKSNRSEVIRLRDKLKKRRNPLETVDPKTAEVNSGEPQASAKNKAETNPRTKEARPLIINQKVRKAPEKYAQDDTKKDDLDAERFTQDSSQKYIHRDLNTHESMSRPDQGPYAVMMVLGLTLMGGFLATIFQGSEILLGANGPLIASIGFMIGLLIFTGALYYFLRAIFVGRKNINE